MDRLDNQCEQRYFHCPTEGALVHCTPPTVTIQPYNTTATTSQSCAQANQSLDTVRSLHQTVVSLRNALDDARREISTLKKQMTVKTVIDEGKTFKENDPGHRRIEEDSSKSSIKQESGQKMGSQIDVKIRVSSNLNVSTDQTTMDTAPDSSRSVVSIKLTSQENLNVSQQDESVYSFNQSTNEEVQLEQTKEGKEGPLEEDEPHPNEDENRHEDEDADKSQSDGDNSVFDDSKETGGYELPKNVLQLPHQKLTRAHSDTQEEVDDIELIFSSDDHRELHEEEMVSISATYEPWQRQGSTGTPVLLSFEKLSLEEDRHGGVTQNRRRQISLEERTERKFSEKSFLKKCSLDKDNEEHSNQSTLGNSKWQGNKKELHVTDISKCGISEENIMDMSRRNTCPNPPVYRPLSRDVNTNALQSAPRTRTSLSANRCILGGKFTRPSRGGYLISSPGRINLRSPLIAITNAGNAGSDGAEKDLGPKRSSSVQTDISALPDHWQSESHLAGGGYGNGLFTLPSKFNPMLASATGRAPRAPLRPSQKTQEARRVLLSDINFTSMIPELSRSADHLCPEDEEDMEGQENQRHGEDEDDDGNRHHPHHNHHHRMHQGHHLQTPNMTCYRKGITPSVSIHSHGSMNENSFATQTTQTGDYWVVHKGDSFDSTSNCYTNDSRMSLNKSCRSRSVPSIKCVYCKRSHGFNAMMKTSESMQYTPRVTAIPESYGAVKGSLPDLRHDCCCPRRYQGHSAVRLHGQSVGSTESLLDDSEVFIQRSSHNVGTDYTMSSSRMLPAKQQSRRCSENDIGRSYTPSKQSLPFLPKSANCLKIGHLAKVIARSGRVVVGKVRYVGPICNAEYVARLEGGSHDTFIGLELPANGGDTDGTIEGKRFFYCEQNHGIFVPFPKVIMAWTS